MRHKYSHFLLAEEEMHENMNTVCVFFLLQAHFDGPFVFVYHNVVDLDSHTHTHTHDRVCLRTTANNVKVCRC